MILSLCKYMLYLIYDLPLFEVFCKFNFYSVQLTFGCASSCHAFFTLMFFFASSLLTGRAIFSLQETDVWKTSVKDLWNELLPSLYHFAKYNLVLWFYILIAVTIALLSFRCPMSTLVLVCKISFVERLLLQFFMYMLFQPQCKPVLTWMQMFWAKVLFYAEWVLHCTSFETDDFRMICNGHWIPSKISRFYQHTGKLFYFSSLFFSLNCAQHSIHNCGCSISRFSYTKFMVLARGSCLCVLLNVGNLAIYNSFTGRFLEQTQ